MKYQAHGVWSDGTPMASLSEMVIRSRLDRAGLPYGYNVMIEGLDGSGFKRPDFLFHDTHGCAIALEYLGLYSDPAYRHRWETRGLPWYRRNPHIYLITMRPRDGKLHLGAVDWMIRMVRDLLANDGRELHYRVLEQQAKLAA